MQVSQEFLDVGWGVKDGLPYTPWASDLLKARRAEIGKNDPTAHCLPEGIAKTYSTPLLRKIVQLPGLVIILSEVNAAYRQIFTDARPLPVDPQPSWDGYSTGKWDSDTLVVETSGFRDGIWLDHKGNPLTEAAKITERFRRVDYGHLQIELTVDDPKAYTHPWTVTLNQVIALDTDLMAYICLENERDVRHFVGK